MYDPPLAESDDGGDTDIISSDINEDVYETDDDDVNDTLVLSSQAPRKGFSFLKASGSKQKAPKHSPLEKESNPDFQVTTMMISDKSAEIIVLVYTGDRSMEQVTREVLIKILKNLGGMVSLVKSLSLKQLVKVIAVKLINKNFVKIVQGQEKVNFFNLKRSDLKKI